MKILGVTEIDTIEVELFSLRFVFCLTSFRSNRFSFFFVFVFQFQMNPNELREQGNLAFKNGEFQTAIDRYTDALTALNELQLDEQTKNDLTKCYSNRSQCHINLEQYHDAIDDATRGKNEFLFLIFVIFLRFQSFGIYTGRFQIVVSTSQCI